MPRVRKGDVVWVEPVLVVEVEFAEWTHDGRLRAPVYLGLRDDKAAERGAPRARADAGTEIRRGKRVLKLSNLDKPFWPEEGITKGDLLAYYRAIAPVLVPHLRDRPFTMKRYPDGWQGKHFFQKDAPKHMPDWIDRRRSRSTSRDTREKRTDRLPARQRRARAAVDGEHGLHRHEHLVLARRPARPAGLGAVRPRPVGATSASRRSSRWRCSSSRCSTCSGSTASRRRAAPTGSTCSSRSRGARAYDDARGSPRSSRGALARDAPGLVDDRVDEGEAARRADRREPERRGQDDRVGLLGAAAGRARPCRRRSRWDEVDAGLDPAGVHDGRGARAASREHGDLFAGVLTARQSLGAGAALARLKNVQSRPSGSRASGRLRHSVAVAPVVPSSATRIDDASRARVRAVVAPRASTGALARLADCWCPSSGSRSSSETLRRVPSLPSSAPLRAARRAEAARKASSSAGAPLLGAGSPRPWCAHAEPGSGRDLARLRERRFAVTAAASRSARSVDGRLTRVRCPVVGPPGGERWSLVKGDEALAPRRRRSTPLPNGISSRGWIAARPRARRERDAARRAQAVV